MGWIILGAALVVGLLIWARAQGMIRPESRPWAWAMAAAAGAVGLVKLFTRRAPSPIAEQLEDEARTAAVVEVRRGEVQAELDAIEADAAAEIDAIEDAAAPAADLAELADDINRDFGGA